MMKFIREAVTRRVIGYMEGDGAQKMHGLDFRNITIDRSSGFVYANARPVASVENDRIYSISAPVVCCLIICKG